MTEDTVNVLIDACFEAKGNSYSPYSKFPVGAALICEDGQIFKGCNVENACYPVGICAEQTAIVSAVASGNRKIKAIAITSNNTKDFIFPCGICCQALFEFGGGIKVYSVKPNRSYCQNTVRDLFPHGFGPEFLDETEKGSACCENDKGCCSGNIVKNYRL